MKSAYTKILVVALATTLTQVEAKQNNTGGTIRNLRKSFSDLLKKGWAKGKQTDPDPDPDPDPDIPPDIPSDTIGSPDYGDLIRLYRNESGVPILTNCETEPQSGCCLRPLATDSDDCPLDCRVNVISGVWVIKDDEEIIDPETCAISTACSACMMETDFGRVNVIRSPSNVFEKQFDEVTRNLQLSQCTTTLDPAGRFVYYKGEEGEEEAFAVDSPLQNLAIYKQLLQAGHLGGPPIPQNQDALLTAARSLGAAVDKSGGGVNVDMISYMNRILGLTDEPGVGKICIWRRREVKGKMVAFEECFLDFSDFTYNRSNNFEGEGAASHLPLPAYIPEDKNLAGRFEYLNEVRDNVFKIKNGRIFEVVFEEKGVIANNVGAFAQAADDTRAVIHYMHTWPIPGDHPTKPFCVERFNLPTYDVYITALQVPEKITIGATGREFSVTAGIDSVVSVAEVLLTVKAESIDKSSGSDVSVSVEYTDYPFNLGPGETHEYKGVVDPALAVSAGETIKWTATVKSEFDYEDGNNEATLTTEVISGGSRKLLSASSNGLRGF